MTIRRKRMKDVSINEINTRKLLEQQQTTKDQLRKLETISSLRSVLLYLRVYAVIFLAFYLQWMFPNPIVTTLMIIFIAGRQHSLYILNHDASHYSLFKSKISNKIVATICSNLVMFHHPEAWSYVLWRRIHMNHHRNLFTEQDPNYIGRQRAGDTQRTYKPAQLFWSCSLVVPQMIKNFFLGRQDYAADKSITVHFAKLNHLATLFVPFKNDLEMETERRIKLVFFLFGIIALSYFNVWKTFLLLWILPMYTFYPMILKFHDLTEHRWEKVTDDVHINTRSVKIGFLAKMLFSYLPRGLHREHHMFPRVSVVNLPKLSKLICSNCNILPPLKGVTQLHTELKVNHFSYAEHTNLEASH